MIDSEFVEVAVDAPLPRVLTYRLPAHLKISASLGSRVTVPLGKRHSRGVVTGATVTDLAEDKIKSVQNLTEEPPLGEKTRAWLKWLSQYYLHPVGQVFALAFAPGSEIRKRKAVKPSPLTFTGIDPSSTTTPFLATDIQKKCIDAITNAAEAKRFETFLLLGVTGSGKTE